MPSRTRNKLVAFFEIRDAAGEPIDEPTPWAEHLADLSKESAKEREHRINTVPHWGQVYTYEETDHLVLARLRDGVSSYNTDTGEIIDTESDARSPWVEISVVHFLPGTNRFGYVLGSNASPRVSSLAGWINSHRIFEEDITIEPVIAKDALARIRGAAEASLLRVKFASDQLTDIKKAGGLYAVSRSLKDEIGHVSVEMILRVEGGKTRSRQQDRMRLMDKAKGLLGRDVTKAVARIVDYDDQGIARTDDVDFLKHRLAKTMKVALTDREGNPVRISSAIKAIYRAAEKFRDELYDT